MSSIAQSTVDRALSVVYKHSSMNRAGNASYLHVVVANATV